MTAKDQAYLHAGFITVHAAPTWITTVLGSCVAVCLYDGSIGLGGMNHYQLALWNGVGLASPRYGNVAIDRLVQKMESLGGERERMRAKVFGGASVLGGAQDSLRIGARNIEIAWDHLQRLNIPIVASDVGGQLGRKVKFDTQTGVAKVKKLPSSAVASTQSLMVAGGNRGVYAG